MKKKLIKEWLKCRAKFWHKIGFFYFKPLNFTIDLVILLKPLRFYSNHCDFSPESFDLTKELSLRHKLWFSNTYITISLTLDIQNNKFC